MGNTFKFIRLVGTSQTGYEDAISNAIKTAGSSLRDLSWFQVVEHRGGIDSSGNVSEWQATIDVAFKVDQGE